MIIILFRPFDSWKWFVIGFNAFLVLLEEGGASFNNPIPFSGHSETTYTEPHFSRSLVPLIHEVKKWVRSIEGTMVSAWLALYLVLGVVFIILWFVLNWVGARGQFIFLDNIVRNRAVISEPWRRYAHQGNRWFLFNMGIKFLTLILVIGSVTLFLVVGWTWIGSERDPKDAEVGVLAVLLFFLGGIWTVYLCFEFMLRSLMTTLLFRQNYGVWTAFRAVLHLMATYPGSMALYLLTNFALWFAGLIVGILVGCMTCCCLIWLACIPLAGTMLVSAVLTQILLPVFIYCRCFQVDCLAQFGPQYDAWIVDVPQMADSSG